MLCQVALWVVPEKSQSLDHYVCSDSNVVHNIYVVHSFNRFALGAKFHNPPRCFARWTENTHFSGLYGHLRVSADKIAQLMRPFA